MANIKVRDNNWMAELANPDIGWHHSLTDLNGLSVRDAQSALDAQYGLRRFYVHDHGTVHVVHDIKKYEEKTGRKHS